MRTRTPAPQEVPFTADQLLDMIKGRGGRVFRKPEVSVFCLTKDGDLAQWLMDVGGIAYRSAAGDGGVGYRRAADGPIEWDIYVHTIPVRGDRSVWEAAGPDTYAFRADIPQNAA